MPIYAVKLAVHRQSNRVWETTLHIDTNDPEDAKDSAEELAEGKAKDIDFNQFSESVHYEVETFDVAIKEFPGIEDTPLLVPREPHLFAKLYQVWGPDGLPIAPILYSTADVALRAAARFVASYQRQGYYRNSRGQELTLDALAMQLRVEELPALMTAREAYDKYLADQTDKDDYMTYNEFLVSEECIKLMDPDAQEDEQ